MTQVNGAYQLYGAARSQWHLLSKHIVARRVNKYQNVLMAAASSLARASAAIEISKVKGENQNKTHHRVAAQ